MAQSDHSTFALNDWILRVAAALKKPKRVRRPAAAKTAFASHGAVMPDGSPRVTLTRWSRSDEAVLTRCASFSAPGISVGTDFSRYKLSVQTHIATVGLAYKFGGP